jgi:GNAT superfamily N-acetyltransferase
MTADQVALDALDAASAAECAPLTFPVYRHLLALRPAPRHPEQGDSRLVQPLGCVARSGGAPIGLALAEQPLQPDDSGATTPEMLSVFVRPEHRGRGVGTALVERLEAELRNRGASEVKAVYMRGGPGIPALERVLARRGWSAPEVRTVTLRFTPEGARATPWYGRGRLAPDEAIFPWTELTAEERDALRRSQAETGWIPAGLEAWEHDRHGFDAVSSVGLRKGGRVVGWVINHRVTDSTVRFTCSFMRKDLGRRGRILPLYTAALERLRESGCAECLFITPVAYPNMVNFVRERCAPWTGTLSETYGVSRRL